MKVGQLLSDTGEEYFYIMHLSYEGRERRRLWQYAQRDRVIGLSHHAVNGDWVEVRELVMGSLVPIWVRQFDMFCCEIGRDDIILILCGWDSLLGIAQTAETHHRYDEQLVTGHDPFFDHVRRVCWIREYEYDAGIPVYPPIEGFNNTLSKVRPHTRRWAILTNIDV